jgi:hypothetical protein
MILAIASRRFVALSAERMKEWMACDLSRLDLLAVQIDGIHITDDLVLLAAVGVDGVGGKHPLDIYHSPIFRRMAHKDALMVVTATDSHSCSVADDDANSQVTKYS